MKFGKLILDVQALSLEAWRPGFMDYKALKKVLKAARPKPADVAPSQLASQLATCPEEVQFFTMLKAELQKVSDFYLVCENEMLARYKELVGSLTMYKEGLKAASSSDGIPLLQSVVQFYMDLLLLENFAVINYCGFGKILKKHDKVTGYVTKEPYMQRMVNPQEFTTYPRLMKMLRHTEQSYQLLLHSFPSSSRAGLLSSESQARLRKLEEAKAHSAAQKASETASLSASEGRASPAQPAMQPMAPSPTGSAGSGAPTPSHAAGAAGAGGAHERMELGAHPHSVLHGGGSSAGHSMPSALKTNRHAAAPLQEVELSAAQALVAVAADAQSSKGGSIASATLHPQPLAVSTGMTAGMPGGFHAMPAPAPYAASPYTHASMGYGPPHGYPQAPPHPGYAAPQTFNPSPQSYQPPPMLPPGQGGGYYPQSSYAMPAMAQPQAGVYGATPPHAHRMHPMGGYAPPQPSMQGWHVQ